MDPGLMVSFLYNAEGSAGVHSQIPTLSACLPVYLSFYLCLPVCLPLPLPACLSTCLSTYAFLSTILQVNLSVYLSVYLNLPVCLPVRPLPASLSTSGFLSVYPVCLSTSAYLSVHLSVYLCLPVRHGKSIKSVISDSIRIQLPAFFGATRGNCAVGCGH